MYHQSRRGDVLDGLRDGVQSQYVAGSLFEELIAKFLGAEARYRDLYARVFHYRDWAKERGLDARDTGIDWVAETHTAEVHAIQCKFYARDQRVEKKDIDSHLKSPGISIDY